MMVIVKLHRTIRAEWEASPLELTMKLHALNLKVKLHARMVSPLRSTSNCSAFSFNLGSTCQLEPLNVANNLLI